MSKEEWKMIKKLFNKNTSKQKGFTLVELLIVIAIVGILSSLAIPIYHQYKGRSYDKVAKASLHNLYLTCKAYWSDTYSSNGCNATIALDTKYGFVESPRVTLVTNNGAEGDFLASAVHLDNPTSWWYVNHKSNYSQTPF